MQCISFVLYSVLINGKAHSTIIPTRGLSQGDPLSPYLFLICANGLSAFIHEAAWNQLLNGISICKGCPIITHLFFAVDNLLFCKANAQECKKLIDIHESYKSTYRQKVNTDKSSVFYSPNSLQETKEEILCILGPM